MKIGSNPKEGRAGSISWEVQVQVARCFMWDWSTINNNCWLKKCEPLHAPTRSAWIYQKSVCCTEIRYAAGTIGTIDMIGRKEYMSSGGIC